MCKHVAATLYGIGTRLDEDASLFFVLRNVNMEDLITQAVRDKSARLLKQAGKKTSRVIDGADLEQVFGIELGPAAPAEVESLQAETVKPRVTARPQHRVRVEKANTKPAKKTAKTTVGKATSGSRTRNLVW